MKIVYLVVAIAVSLYHGFFALWIWPIRPPTYGPDRDPHPHPNFWKAHQVLFNLFGSLIGWGATICSGAATPIRSAPQTPYCWLLPHLG